MIILIIVNKLIVTRGYVYLFSQRSSFTEIITQFNRLIDNWINNQILIKLKKLNLEIIITLSYVKFIIGAFYVGVSVVYICQHYI